jgi:hypothetical protein
MGAIVQQWYWISTPQSHTDTRTVSDMTLPSNSSEKYYGIQPLCNYRTRLAKPLDLNLDEWNLGLAEIM